MQFIYFLQFGKFKPTRFVKQKLNLVRPDLKIYTCAHIYEISCKSSGDNTDDLDSILRGPVSYEVVPMT